MKQTRDAKRELYEPFGVMAKLNSQTSAKYWDVSIGGLFLDYLTGLHPSAIKCFTHLVVCGLWSHVHIERNMFLRSTSTINYGILLLVEITGVILHLNKSLSKSTVGVSLPRLGCFTFLALHNIKMDPLVCVLSLLKTLTFWIYLH